ncbi:MAG: ABC transporter substrate-binding protein [Firmicutes bacterium]|nr:ABC transporter substrate-binding protein [Bacillota bacterium]
MVSLFFSGCKGPKTYKIGILAGLNYFAAVTDGFKAKLTELGYIEGNNISYNVKRSNFDTDEYRSAIQEFIAAKADLIFVFPTEASLEVKQATQETDIPVVFAVANIEDTGLVRNIREPGGNMTGVRYPGPDIAVKRFEVMRELAPKAKRYWIPYQKGYPIVNSQLKVLKPVAAAAGVTLIEAPVSNAAELEVAIQAQLKAGGMDVILFLAEPLAVTPENFVVMGKFAYRHKIPWGGAFMEVEGYKTIFGVNIDSFKTGEQAAIIAGKILRGAKAGSIPVVSSEYYMTLDYQTAQKFGVNVSESLLSQANKVIQ